MAAMAVRQRAAMGSFLSQKGFFVPKRRESKETYSIRVRNENLGLKVRRQQSLCGHHVVGLPRSDVIEVCCLPCLR